jgi:hypothetical protein
MIDDSELRDAVNWRPSSPGLAGLPWRVIGYWMDDEEPFSVAIEAQDPDAAAEEAYRRHDPLRASLIITEVVRPLA